MTESLFSTIWQAGVAGLWITGRLLDGLQKRFLEWVDRLQDWSDKYDNKW